MRPQRNDVKFRILIAEAMRRKTDRIWICESAAWLGDHKLPRGRAYSIVNYVLLKTMPDCDNTEGGVCVHAQDLVQMTLYT